MRDESTPVICVDLDGTLLYSDTLVESAFALLRDNVLYVFLFPFWLAKGKAHLKAEIARRIDIDPAVLPYNLPLLNHLRTLEKDHTLVLCTGANENYAKAIAIHLGIFSAVHASDGLRNLSGDCKAARLVEEYGRGGFSYAGNSKADVAVWEASAGAIVVNAVPSVESAAGRATHVIRVFPRQSNQIQEVARALRPHQWLKNTLLFTPLIASHRVVELALVGEAALGFIAFCMTASCVYLLNDMVDLSADRRHPDKRKRPFASGALPTYHGLVAAASLLCAAAAVAVMLPHEFGLVLSTYFAVTVSYTFRLKRVLLLDVLTLAGLYTARVLAGGAAIGIMPSFWLLSLSMFLFLSLALVKRYTELQTTEERGEKEAVGRAYRTVDIEGLAQLGVTSGFVAVLVLALYINSSDVTLLYSHPEILWGLCPLLIYGISRTWLMARRGEVNEDPVVFVISDRLTQILVVIGGALIWLAS